MFNQVGLSVVTIMSLWTSTCVITGGGALIGALIVPKSDESGNFELFVKAMEGLAAGAMLTMIAQVRSRLVYLRPACIRALD